MTFPALGEPGSRNSLNTPCLVLDLDALERNIELMQATVSAYGKLLRPHAKSHKCSRIALAQVAAGAVGVCCATIDEAEVMLGAGIPSVLITSPQTTAQKIARICDLARGPGELLLVVDNALNVRDLSDALVASGAKLGLHVDLDPGFCRTGVLDPFAAVALADVIRTVPNVWLAGLQCYAGGLQHIADAQERAARATQTGSFVAAVKAALEAAGHAVPVVTGSGTGTHAIDGQQDVFDEMQLGSYVFMDVDYGAAEYDRNGDWPFDFSLTVQTAVVSTNAPASVTTDAGTKAFALNGPRPVVATEGFEGFGYDFAGDEHGKLIVPARADRPVVGSRLECYVSHCDPTIALYDALHCVRGDRLVDVWPIDARGRR